ncbi:uncharacterized protein TNCV_1424751 [Trichonephila clavipes]|nr:uncharacterized protein TNCV_1424751 [Trichonephila clavipes]
MTTIVAGLKPVKIGLEKLCSRNATFLTAECVFSFVFGELNEQNSEFAKNMKYSLIQIINEKRNVNLIGLMQYLNFERKYLAAAVTVDISRLPRKKFLLQETKLPVRLINTANEQRLVQGHEATALRVKGDIEDVHSELDNGDQRLHFLDRN